MPPGRQEENVKKDVLLYYLTHASSGRKWSAALWNVIAVCALCVVSPCLCVRGVKLLNQESPRVVEKTASVLSFYELWLTCGLNMLPSDKDSTSSFVPLHS